jgi:hypothetical protein
MRPRVLSVLLLTLVFVAALGGAASASILPEAPYTEPADCYSCHAEGGVATGAVDFGALPVDYSSCASCHLGMPGIAHYHFGYPAYPATLGQVGCLHCHDDEAAFAFDLPANATAVAGYRSPTAFGYFATATSLDTPPADLHEIHRSTGWVESTFGAWGSSCSRCHAAASCSTCHRDSLAHADHTSGTYAPVTVRQATGSSVVQGPVTCVAVGCHADGSTAGVSVPTCASCHARASSATHDVVHTAADGAVSGTACSVCHSLALVDEHAEFTSTTAGSACAACHPNPADSTAPSWDGTCATASCHTAGSSAPMHANATSAHTVTAEEDSCLDCHAGTDYTSIHSGAVVEATGKASCQVCHSGIEGEPVTGGCTTCHFTFEDHYGTSRHQSISISCGGEGCHATPDLSSVHSQRNPEFGCQGCHSSIRTDVQYAIQNGLTGCGDCHGTISAIGGHRSAHWANPLLVDGTAPRYSYYTGSAGTMPTSDCAGCHTSNLVDEHLGVVDAGTGFIIRLPRYDSTGNALTCDSCHSASAMQNVKDAIAGSGLTACENCHEVHGPMQAVHASSFKADPELACADCHSNVLSVEHNGTYQSSAGLAGCDVCHALYSGMSGTISAATVQGAIAVTNDTACTACHSAYHTDTAPHAASSAATAECAICHAAGETTVDVTAIHADAVAGPCKVCHSSTRIGDVTTHTAECASCHSTEGSDYHMDMPVHVAPESAGCQVTGCHHNKTDVREIHADCATCHADASDPGKTTACENCHAVQGTDYHYDFDADHTPADTYSQDCANCHETTDLRTLHVTNGCNTCHFQAGCNDCHQAHMGGPGLLKSTSCSTCHDVEGTNYHSAMDASHTYTAMPASCTNGSRCHAANTLPEEHQRFITEYGYASTCDLCHKNPDSTRIDWSTATADCSSCHDVHGDIGTIHTATNSQACVDCHETGDVRNIHGTSAETSCDVCHSAAAGRIEWATATIECASCHVRTPLESGHYPAASHDAAAESGCGQCHYMDMKAEHFKSTVAVSCVTCHEVKVDNFTAAWDKTCAACHPTKHGDQSLKHTSTNTTCGGVGCHAITDVAAIHDADGGPGCGACHVNPSTPATTTNCTASGCHAGVGTDHKALHDAATVNPAGCSGCHLMNLVDEHSALGFTCDTCHKSTVSTVQAAITANDLRCKSCHAGAHQAQSFEFNPGRASVHRVSADLPGMRSSFVVNGTTYAMSLPSAGSFLKSGWTTSSMMDCTSCHSYSGATGPHGGTMKVNIDPAYPNSYAITAGTTRVAQLSPSSPTGMSMTKSGSTAAGIICEKCHDLNGTGSGFSNVVHKEHDDRGSEGGYCNYCHVTLPHGWNLPRMIGYTTDPAPYNTYKGGVQRISLKSYSPSGWSKSDCGAACSSSRHPLTGSTWPSGGTQPPAPTTGNVSGTVTNTSSAAIAGATVSIAGKTATTGGTGAYSITEIAGGTYTMTVNATGYNAWSGTVTVTNGQAVIADVSLAPLALVATNLARNATAAASSRDSDSTSASKANDGNASTYWRSASRGTEWLRLDFGSAKTFDKVVVNWNSNGPARYYRIETSNDGSNWTTRYSTSSGNGGVDTITFTSLSARYVRLYCWSGSYDYRVNEFEVWGN